MRTRAIASAVCGLALLSPATLADPLGDLTKAGSDACFRRAYDAAHLTKNPRQQVTIMVAWINANPQHSGNLGLAITRRSDPQVLFLAGDCNWSEGDHAWMKSYRKKGGAGCVTLAVPDVFEASSAEEGGGVLLDPAADGRTLMVHLDDEQIMVRRADRARKISVKLGADDRVFMLRRTETKDCDFVKEALTTPEPRARQR
jgi:hypothetical protein